MKKIIILLVIFAIIGLIGFITFQKLPKLSSPSHSSSESNSQKATQTISGVLRKIKGDDYDYMIVSGGKSTGIASYSVKLDLYEGIKVQITGQYSGTTMYADSVKEIP
jgi:hypothetical protein